MKMFYDQHFRVRENEKIREHVMMARIFVAIAVVCVSLCSMGITAYAFFTYTVTSSTNVIKAASHWTSKTVTTYDSAGVSVASVSEDDYIVLQNDSEETYTYELSLKAAGTASVGYAVLELTTYNKEGEPISEIFWTDSIRKDGFVIRIVVPAGNTATLQVTDNWGTCARKGLLASGTVLEPVFPVKEVAGTPVEEEPVVETPVEEEPVADTPVEDEPVVETPVEDEPVVETPVEDEPVVETPVEDEPVVETPVEDEPVVETPVEETPVEEAPADVVTEESE